MLQGRPLSKSILALLTAITVMSGGCATRSSRQIMLRSNLQVTASSPKVLAAYMPWFGDHKHIDVGYSSHDPEVLSRQIDEARDMGISGFVVDWNGDRRPYTDKSFALLQQAAYEKKFQVALLYNEAEEDGDEATTDAIAAMDKAYRVYIGPEARFRDAYLTYQGRPVIFIFPKRGHTDWNRVRQHVSEWSAPPLLIYKDQAPGPYHGAFDGYYAWVHPGKGGWAPDGSNWGEEYLESFYKRMKEKEPGKLVVGGAWASFDDSRASWGLNRRINARCGKTLQETLSLWRNYFSDSSSLPFLMIDTWNDYEEGSAIERKQFSRCSEDEKRNDMAGGGRK
jgi:hypothetical protein